MIFIDTYSPLSSTAVVTIKIADVQDTPPVFDKDSYDTSVDENTPEVKLNFQIIYFLNNS